MTAVRVPKTGRGSAENHSALKVQEAQVVTEDPIPAKDDVELRPDPRYSEFRLKKVICLSVSQALFPLLCHLHLNLNIRNS